MGQAPDTERLSSFWVPSTEARRFAKQVAHGDRGTVLTNLFLAMQKATETDRKLWRALLAGPENVEIKRV